MRARPQLCFTKLHAGAILPTLRFNRSLRVPTAKLRLMLGLDPDPSGGSPTAEVVPLHRESRW